MTESLNFRNEAKHKDETGQERTLGKKREEMFPTGYLGLGGGVKKKKKRGIKSTTDQFQLQSHHPRPCLPR